MTIDIVLATYNGEKYLRDFIESLQNQTYPEWNLIVSDDASEDGTVAIIEDISHFDDRITLINIERQGGVISNFKKALSYSTAEYIMFADQDDVWLPEKLEKSLFRLKQEEEEEGKELPLLLFTDLTVVDDKLNVISPSFYKYRNLNPSNNTSFNYLLWCSTLYGCTLLFNRSLWKMAKDMDDRVMMHDQIFGVFAALFGKTLYLNEPTVLYRQHDSNEVGALKRNLLYKPLNIFMYCKKVLSYHERFVSQTVFLREYLSRKTIRSDSKELLELALSPDCINRIKFWYICVLPFLRERASLNIALSFAMLFCTPDEAGFDAAI